MQSSTETVADKLGADAAERPGRFIVPDDQLSADALRAGHQLIIALRGDDLDEQWAGEDELRRLKRRDIDQIEGIVAVRRSRDVDESSGKRVKVHHFRSEP